MIFSHPTEYAIRALSELVSMSDNSAPGFGRAGHYVKLNTLLEHTTLPHEFLAKIFRHLVEARILQSAKGPGGGFVLARPAHKISLLDIAQAVDGGHRVEGCMVGLAQCNEAMPCPQHDLFKPIRQKIRSYLSSTTLADIAASLKKTKAWSAKNTLIKKGSRRG